MKIRHLAFVCLFAAPSFSADEKAPPTFSTTAETTVVEVPVHVTGKDGQPMRGLKKEDFELSDDGKAVKIDEIEVIDLDEFGKEGTTAAPGAPPQPERVLPSPARRHFFLLFDLSFSKPINVARARKAAREFVDMLKPGDSVAVATADVEKGMKLVLSFSSDRVQIDHALETLSLPNMIQAGGDPLALVVDIAALEQVANSAQANRGDAAWAEGMADAMRNTQKSLDNLEKGRVTGLMNSFSDLARTLNSVRGRKQIIYFSEGVDSKLITGSTGANAGSADSNAAISGETWKVDNENRFGNTSLQNNLQDMLKLFNRSDCVLYSFDISGLTARSSDVRNQTSASDTANALEGSRGRGTDSLFMFAHETGGEVFKNTNDIPGQLEKLQRQTSLVYLLVFSPAKLTAPGTYHQLKVKVKASGAKISARSGYYEPRPWAKLSPNEKRLATAELIAYGLPRADVPSQVVAAPFRFGGPDIWETPVIVEIPGEKILQGQNGDTASVEVYGYVLDKGLRVIDFFTQAFKLDLKKVRSAVTAGGIKYYGSVFVPPGAYSLKVLVRNSETGRTGLQIIPLTAPAADRREPLALQPFFEEAPGRWLMVKGTPRPKAPASGGYPFAMGGESFIPAAGPILPSGAPSKVCVMAYNVPAQRDMDVSGRVTGRDGRDIGAASLKRLGPDEPGPGPVKKMLCSFQPDGLAKGLYSLVVTVKNPENGLTSESTAPFEIR